MNQPSAPRGRGIPQIKNEARKAMQLYANPNRPEHAKNNAVFTRVVNDYPQISLFQPSPEKAPWHWQAVIDTGGEAQLINFWPHTLKGQRDGYKAVEGEHALRGIIEQAIIDADEPPLDVVEDCA